MKGGDGMQCSLDVLEYNYLERISCTNYYHKGQLVKPDRPVEIIMLGLSVLGMGAISDHEFEIGDILLYDIKLEGIPFDKLMGEILCIQKQGYMYRLDIRFLGMPNTLFDMIKKMMK